MPSHSANDFPLTAVSIRSHSSRRCSTSSRTGTPFQASSSSIQPNPSAFILASNRRWAVAANCNHDPSLVGAVNNLNITVLSGRPSASKASDRVNAPGHFFVIRCSIHAHVSRDRNDWARLTSTCWPCPLACTLVQRSERSVHGELTRRERGERGRDERRDPRRRAHPPERSEHPQLGHDQTFVGGHVGVRPEPAETGDRRVDEPRVDRRQRLVAQPMAIEHTRTTRLDDHVGRAGEVAHQPGIGRRDRP